MSHLGDRPPHAVGLYETAVDEPSSWDRNGKHVRLKANRYGPPPGTGSCLVWARARGLPPHGLDVTDSFFARQVPV